MIKSYYIAILLASPLLFTAVLAEEPEDELELVQELEQELSPEKEKEINKDRVVAIERAEAVYPKKALNKCVEGHVLVSFVITTEGKTKDIVVLSARPERVFDKAAVEAVEKWLFEPRILNGVPVNRETRQRLVFEPGCTR